MSDVLSAQQFDAPPRGDIDPDVRTDPVMQAVLGGTRDSAGSSAEGSD